jgi:hypothetical protein
MKKILRSQIVRILFAIFVTLGLADLSVGAANKDARVTQVIKDVRLLAAGAGARPAAVNDGVGAGQAVRTGLDSRAELTFTDMTITRLGANTVFSYNEGAKEVTVEKGAILMCVPKQAGTVKINTAAATAAVTGFTAVVESHKKGLCKIILVEGKGCVTLKRRPNEPCLELNPGEMLTLPDGATRFSEKKQVDIDKLSKSGDLFKGFKNKLPPYALAEIQVASDNQQGGPPPGGGYTDPTGTDKVDQKTAANEPTPRATPRGSPPGARRDRPRRRER